MNLKSNPAIVANRVRLKEKMEKRHRRNSIQEMDITTIDLDYLNEDDSESTN